MQKAERNAFNTENGALVNNDGSNSSLETGTNLFTRNLNPITQTSLVPSFSIALSEIGSGDDTIIRAEKVVVIDDQGTLSNGGLDGMLSTERESTARDAKLTTIKKEANFDLRKYDMEKKPTKLFSDNEERKYQTVIIKETAGSVMLEKERREIIRNQAMKKSTTIAEKQASTEPLHLEVKPSLEDSTQKQDESLIQMSSANANSFSFHKESPISHPEDINTQQINFATARQQFLEMEKSRQEVPTSQRPSAQSHKVLGLCSTPSESTQPLQDKDCTALDTSPTIMVKAVRVDNIHEDQNDDEHPWKSPVSNSLFQKVATLEDNDGERLGPIKRNLLAYSSIDDLDSGLGEMTNDYGYTSDGGVSNEMLNMATDNSSVFELSEQKPMPETPIEKEIRLALEREEVLRKERGIRKSVNSEEMVQIKTKPLLSQTPPTSSFVKNKEKNRMVFFVQREIEMDSKREEKLKQEGKVKGLYDKGIPQEVEERKKVFEQQTDDVPVVPQVGWQPKLVSSASEESLDVHTVPEESNTAQPDSTECKELVENISEHQPYTLRPWKFQTNLLIEQEIEEEQRREEELRARRLRQQSDGSLPSKAASTAESQRLPACPETSRAGALDDDQPKDLPAMPGQNERKAKPSEKKDESSYAGIKATDDINTEVLESTRVTRRKNALAQRWEDGIFSNHQEE